MTQQRECQMPFLDAVAQFMRQGGQSTDRFNAQQAALYLGLQLEELAEKVAVIMGGCVDKHSLTCLQPLLDTLTRFSSEFKQGLHQGDILRSNHTELLDADFDLVWVSIAALFSASPDAQGAVRHGTFTNLDKFRNGCIKDANGKIQKPPGWQAPNFEPYTDKTIRV